MALPIPKIDDRRYTELVQALMSELPQLSVPLAPEGDETGFDAWSDHNASQTGVAVMELLAAMGEMILYRCDHIDEKVKENFLRLVLDRPEPVTTRVRFVRAAPSVPLAVLPGGVVFPPEMAGRIVFTGLALEFNGLMSEAERDSLVLLDPNPPPTAYTRAVVRLYQRSNHIVRIPAGTQLGTPTDERFETVDTEEIPAGASRAEATARHRAVDTPFVLTTVGGAAVQTDGVAGAGGLPTTPGTPGQRFRLETRPSNPDKVLPVLLEPLRARTRIYDPNPRITLIPPAPDPTQTWAYVPDFLEAGPNDRAFSVDRLTYELVFGDGRRGLIPPPESQIQVDHLQRVQSPEAQAAAAQLNQIAETAVPLESDPGPLPGTTPTYVPSRTRILQEDGTVRLVGALVQTAPMTEGQREALLLAVPGDPVFREAVDALFEVSNLSIRSPIDLPGVPILATGGRHLFDRQNAETDGLVTLRDEDRVISTRDFETRLENAFNDQILDGPRIHKVHARRIDNVGTILVVVLPEPGLTDRWPVTSPLLRARAQLYLETRRLITTRVVIRSPNYRRFEVRIELRARSGTDPAVVRDRAMDGVFQLFDPFEGGPDGTGWPMGRPIQRSEIFQRLHDIDGVSQVPTLWLLFAGGEVSSIEIDTDGLPRLERTAIQVGILS